MIKSNELRIGNLVYYEKDKCNVNVGVGDFLYKENEYFQPIPLTKEWLVKFGFETFQYGGQGNITNAGTLKDIEVCLIHNTIYRGGYRAINYKLEYVHQLQNFYFATENEELKNK